MRFVLLFRCLSSLPNVFVVGATRQRWVELHRNDHPNAIHSSLGEYDACVAPPALELAPRPHLEPAGRRQGPPLDTQADQRHQVFWRAGPDRRHPLRLPGPPSTCWRRRTDTWTTARALAAS